MSLCFETPDAAVTRALAKLATYPVSQTYLKGICEGRFWTLYWMGLPLAEGHGLIIRTSSFERYRRVVSSLVVERKRRRMDPGRRWRRAC